jgi:hypothetical protein
MVRIPFRGLTGADRSFARRDRMMALFAPIGLLTLVAAWPVPVATGFMAMLWAVEQQVGPLPSTSAVRRCRRWERHHSWAPAPG